jgi:hypothetical protein
MPVAAEMHESNIRVYKVTPGTKSSSNPAVSTARLPAVAKQSRLPFAGSEISFQLLSNGTYLMILSATAVCKLRTKTQVVVQILDICSART